MRDSLSLKDTFEQVLKWMEPFKILVLQMSNNKNGHSYKNLDFM